MKTVNVQINQLNTIQAHINNLYQNWVKKKGINYSTFLVLYALIEQKQMTQRQLVDRTHQIKQTINNVVKELEEKNYVVCGINPLNKREKFICLTDSGKTYAHSIVDELLELEERIAEKAGEEALNQLIELNHKFEQILEEEMKQ